MLTRSRVTFWSVSLLKVLAQRKIERRNRVIKVIGSTVYVVNTSCKPPKFKDLTIGLFSCGSQQIGRKSPYVKQSPTVCVRSCLYEGLLHVSPTV